MLNEIIRSLYPQNKTPVISQPRLTLITGPLYRKNLSKKSIAITFRFSKGF